ncbi:MAG: hypothetical protein V3R25_09265 [Nitrosomonadaceae bacterium]
MRVDIKPLSVNQCWTGQRFKTDDYKLYESTLLIILPKIELPEKGPLEITLDFGFSSGNSDWDNPIKAFVDILQKKYGFNDNRIFKGTITKTMVTKGNEYVEFELKEMKSSNT